MVEHVAGLADLERALNELPKAVGRGVLRRVGVKALKPFVDHVKELAPVDADPASSPKRRPGTLKKSYRAGTRLTRRQAAMAKGEGKSSVEVYAGTSDPAGLQTELGNAHQAAQPHARPAWDGTHSEVLALVGTGLAEEIEKAREKLARKAEREAAAAGN